MTEERRRILRLVAAGKITVDEAERLFQALGEKSEEGESADPDARETRALRFLMISVKKKTAWSNEAVDEARKAWGWPAFRASGRDKEVCVRVPMSLVCSGMRLGAIIPGMAGRSARLRERGIDLDFSKLDPTTLESMLSELGEMNIDVDSGRAEVRIRCEEERAVRQRRFRRRAAPGRGRRARRAVRAPNRRALRRRREER